MAVTSVYNEKESLLVEMLAALFIVLCQCCFHFLIVFAVHFGPLMIYQQTKTEQRKVKDEDYPHSDPPF